MRRPFLLIASMLLAWLVASGQGPSSSKGATLQVQVTYTGSGTVDDSHKIYIALWDSPDFVKEGAGGVTPLALTTLTSKSAIATFEDVQKSPVYVSLLYDSTGKWDAQSDPPSGVSFGLYSQEPGVPAPIRLEAGKTVKVSVTFDDSYKKP